MSWSGYVRIPAAAGLQEAKRLINSIDVTQNEEAPTERKEQVEAAKQGVFILFHSVPAGPGGWVVSISGHASPGGEGSSDSVACSVNQVHKLPEYASG